jgi:hypothetical protein
MDGPLTDGRREAVGARALGPSGTPEHSLYQAGTGRAWLRRGMGSLPQCTPNNSNKK